jgi:serine/threonine protein phosphatase 1
MRYYAIGDLHGRLDLLEKSCQKIFDHVQGKEFSIITLGDYIDRGSNSRGVIEYLMAHPEIIALKGNHEAIAVQTISCSLNTDWWKGNGGLQTLHSYGQPRHIQNEMFTSLVPEEHIKWMNTLPLYYETEKQVFVHAGIHDKEAPLEQQQFDTRPDGALYIIWMLYDPSNHGGWRDKHVVHGHHQFADGPHIWQPSGKGGGRTDLDTYAWKTGRIVIGVFDDTQGPALEFIEVTDETTGSGPELQSQLV